MKPVATPSHHDRLGNGIADRTLGLHGDAVFAAGQANEPGIPHFIGPRWIKTLDSLNAWIRPAIDQ